MAIQKVNRLNLGCFEYDDSIWQMNRDMGMLFLTYKDKNVVDGSKIKIPQGITNCMSMFEDCTKMRVAPVIPDGVDCCRAMFYNCRSLVEAPKFPKGIIECKHMFYNCTSLQKVGSIPSSVEDVSFMFGNCIKLTCIDFKLTPKVMHTDWLKGSGVVIVKDKSVHSTKKKVKQVNNINIYLITLSNGQFIYEAYSPDKKLLCSNKDAATIYAMCLNNKQFLK